MAYRLFPPCDALRPYVQAYWAFDSRSIDGTAAMLRRRLPDGTASVVITIENFSLVDRGQGWQASAGSQLQGVSSAAYLLRAQPRTLTFGVIFWPEAAGLLFGLPLGELADGATGLDSVLSAREKGWVERVRNAENDEERVRITEAFFLDRLRRGAGAHPYLGQAMQLIRGSGGAADVEQLSGQLFVSRRQLERQFRQHIGLSPKSMLRIERFRRAMGLVRQKGDRGMLTRVAHHCGYADQAHFIRDCRELAGVTPSQLLDPAPLSIATVLF